uniref:RBR-type E3 ubiquitin transferase n=1 Tax=Psilocybe cubensis TaxID=181762 RepID=A0A8H7YC95_PSICU
MSVTEIAVKHLPPIFLDISLPQCYPLSDPPTIGSIKFHSSWLMGADGLKATLLDMWDAGETTIYSWIEYLQTGQFLGEDEKLRKKIFYDPPGQLSEILLDYDLKTQRTAFLEGTYLCDVCFEYKKGTQCIFLSCSHTFCKACLREFWTAAVQEGDIGKLVCINPKCMKTKTVASEEELRDVLSDNAFRRWKWLKEKREFEQDVNHAYCPICESPARPSTDHVPEDKDGPWSRYRECPKCRFTFCRVCRCVWHGAHFDCPVPVQILTRYMDATKNGTDTSWMKLVEQTYTSGVLQRQIKRFREEAKKLRKTHSSKPTSAQDRDAARTYSGPKVAIIWFAHCASNPSAMAVEGHFQSTDPKAAWGNLSRKDELLGHPYTLLHFWLT